MSDNVVTFGKKESGGLLQSTLSSAVNVGATIGVGAGIGAGIGKLASLTPYKPSPADLTYQYKDMFERAVSSKAVPENIKHAGDEFIKLFKEGRKAYVTDSINSAALSKQIELKTLAEYVEMQNANPIAKKLNSIPQKEEIQAVVKKVLKNKSAEELTQEEMLKGLKGKFNRITKFLEKRKLSNLDEVSSKFAEKAGSNERLKELAEKGAKHLRNKSIIGVGIAIGVMSALVLNILKTYGVLKFPKIGKKQAEAPAQAQLQNQPQISNLTQVQTTQG